MTRETHCAILFGRKGATSLNIRKEIRMVGLEEANVIRRTSLEVENNRRLFVEWRDLNLGRWWGDIAVRWTDDEPSLLIIRFETSLP